MSEKLREQQKPNMKFRCKTCASVTEKPGDNTDPCPNCGGEMVALR